MPGVQELLVIGVVAVLVFGPDRLPELARNLGKWFGKFRSVTQRNVDELKQMSEIRELQSELSSLRHDLERTRRGVGLDSSASPRRSGSSGNGRGFRLQGDPQESKAAGANTSAKSGGGDRFGAAPGPATIGLRPSNEPAPVDQEAT